MALFETLFHTAKKKLALLIDPDKTQGQTLTDVCKSAEKAGFDLILVGGSILWQSTSRTVATIKESCSLPVILFPGNGFQVCDNADAILFMSLISGRNPDFLIGHQVISAPIVSQL